MTKISVTFEADSWAQLTADLHSAIHLMENTPSAPTTVDKIFEQEEARLAAEAAAAPAPAPPKAAKAATRKRPEQAAPPPVEPEPEPETEPAPPTAPEIPTLEELKQAVTVAVRAAQKNGGPRKILDLLPGFKQSTGLDFVMNSKEEHRGALFDLVNKAGINVGQLAAV